MTEETIYVGVDVAKSTLDVAASNSKETRQFDNNHQGITSAVRYIAGLKPGYGKAVFFVEENNSLQDSLQSRVPFGRSANVFIHPQSSFHSQL